VAYAAGDKRVWDNASLPHTPIFLTNEDDSSNFDLVLSNGFTNFVENQTV